MAVEILTKDDLEEFRIKLLDDIKELIGKSSTPPKKWIKSYQVKNMLKISGGTLQTLRGNGTLQFTRIGGIIYYKYDDIVKILEGKNVK